MSTLEWGPTAGVVAAEAPAARVVDEQEFLRQVIATVHEMLEAEAERWTQLGAPWTDPVNELCAYLSGGKSLRPRFCFWTAQAMGEQADPDHLVRAGAALELLHVFALIHDDLMDGSDARRGRPSLHVRYAKTHRGAQWAGASDVFGTSLALLSGDLAFALANRLVNALPQACSDPWASLVSELVVGQYLDVAAPARRDRSEEVAVLISRLKSSSYSVEGPMRIGAAVTGGELGPYLSRYGSLVGDAFQRRDDLIGIFGDSAVTGKPVGDDLRAGKTTHLLVEARRLASRRDREVLELAGTPGLSEPTVRAIVQVIERCGARDEVERRIEGLVRAAVENLDASGINARAYQGLANLARSAAFRSN